MLSPRLRAAYAHTLYGAGDIVTCIGRRSPALDALMLARRAKAAGFVTAWNPYSRKMPRGWNERMLARLREAARGHVLAEGWGRGRGWAERHLLIAGDPRWIAHLARRFRQHALVMVAPRHPARIVLGLRPPATDAQPHPLTKAEIAGP